MCEGKRDFWWIDWEHAGERIFFYDYFFYILHSALYFGREPFEAYLGGEGDEELSALFREMKEMNTDEARLYKALDNAEALVSHNEADISSWCEREYEENLTYGQKNCEWSEWTRKLREKLRQDSLDKINREGK